MYVYNIVLSEKDYIQFNEYHLMHSKVGKKALLAYRSIFPMLSFLAIIIFLIADAELNLIIIEAIVLGILSIIGIIYSKKILIKSIIKNVKKIKRDGRLPFENEVTMTFNEEGIFEKSRNSESKTSYSIIEKIAQTEQAVYIYISALQAFILPKSCFSTDEEKNEFINFIESKHNEIKNI